MVNQECPERKLIEIINEKPIWPHVQPNHHPDMVRSVDSLVIGEKYRKIYAIGESNNNLIFIGLDGEDKARFKQENGNEYEIYLSDCAILPIKCSDGKETWNPTNYLVRLR